MTSIVGASIASQDLRGLEKFPQTNLFAGVCGGGLFRMGCSLLPVLHLKGAKGRDGYPLRNVGREQNVGFQTHKVKKTLAQSVLSHGLPPLRLPPSHQGGSF